MLDHNRLYTLIIHIIVTNPYQSRNERCQGAHAFQSQGHMSPACTVQQLDPTCDLNQLGKPAGNQHCRIRTVGVEDYLLIPADVLGLLPPPIIHQHVRQLNLNPISTGWSGGGAGRANNYVNNPETTLTQNKKAFTNLIQSLTNQVTIMHPTV